jgi:lipoate-protein ligase B
MVCIELPESKKTECFVCLLGTVAFPEAMELEHRLLQLRFEEKIGDTLLIFEHPPTVTLGRFGNLENILLPSQQLEQRGIAYYDSDRGGDATYNCPGQPVIHPIMNLRTRGARAYVSNLQEMALRVVRDYGIAAERLTEHPGLWVNGKQIAAIGLHLRHGITMHGLSLNVNPDLAGFEVINLCGLPGRSATSIEAELGQPVSVDEVVPKIVQSFSDIFGTGLLPISREQLWRVCFDPQPA